MKNILIIGDLPELKAELGKTGFFSGVETSLSIEARELEKIDILIVDSRIVPYSKYIQNFSKFLKNIKSNYYIAGDMDTYSTVNKTLSSYGIIVIPPLLTDTQVSQKICSLSIEDFHEGKNTVCFFGSSPEVGVGMISTSVAQVTASITEKSVVLLNLGGSEGSDYFYNSSGSGLAGIKDRLINNILTPEELKNSCVKDKNLYILPGEKEISKVRHYHPAHIEKLTGLSNETFDITIINGGSTVSGMGIGTLNSSKIKYMVATQSEKNFKNFRNLQEQIFSKLGISPDDFFLVVNKYMDLVELDTEIVLAKKYHMQVASVIPLLDYPLSLEAEKEKKTLISYDRLYSSSIKQLAVSMCKTLGIEITGATKNDGEGSSFFKKILGKA